MPLPWVSRERFNDIVAESDRLRIENAQYVARVIASAATKAESETRCKLLTEQLAELQNTVLALEMKLSDVVNHPADAEDMRPIGGRVRLRDVISRANADASKRNNAKGK